jgi:hypothetical protein
VPMVVHEAEQSLPGARPAPRSGEGSPRVLPSVLPGMTILCQNYERTCALLSDLRQTEKAWMDEYVRSLDPTPTQLEAVSIAQIHRLEYNTRCALRSTVPCPKCSVLVC